MTEYPPPFPQTTNDFHFKSYNAQTVSTDYKERGIFSPPPDKRKLTNVVVNELFVYSFHQTLKLLIWILFIF